MIKIFIVLGILFNGAYVFAKKAGVQAFVEYSLKSGIRPVELTLRNTSDKDKLKPGEKFYIEKVADVYYIVKPPLYGRYRAKSNQELWKLIRNGQVNTGKHLKECERVFDGPMDRRERCLPKNEQNNIAKMRKKKAAAAKRISNLKKRKEKKRKASAAVVRKSSTALAVVERYNMKTKEVGCDDGAGERSDIYPYEQCSNKNNYVENEIMKVLDPKSLNSNKNQAEKMCVLAGLKNSNSIKVAVCKNNVLQPKSVRVCKSQEYVSFIINEINAMAKCYPNVSFGELIPLVNIESRFNLNAYNKNANGSLNASGLMQVTQDLIETQKKSMIINADIVQTPYCQAMKDGIKNKPLSTKRNVCERTSFPGGVRKNMYLAITQYHHNKKIMSEMMDDLQKYYFKDKYKLFSNEDKELLLRSLSRLMHNRGGAKIRVSLQRFMFDLFHGAKGQKNTGKRMYDKKKLSHGNAAIYKLWGTEGMKVSSSGQTVNPNTFLNNFSSYMLYEGKKRSHGVKREPSDTRNLDVEAGTYLNKMACDQSFINNKANQLQAQINERYPAEKYTKKINCGSPGVSSGKTTELVDEIAKYQNICAPGNSKKMSRQVCATKKISQYPGGREKIRKLKANKEDANAYYLKSCSSDILFGLSARPLAKYYSANPGKYR